MNDNSTYYIDLITRYFAGEITDDELRLLSEWLKSDTQNAEIFKQIQKTWNLIEEQKIKSTINTDQEWAELQIKMEVPAFEKEIPGKVVQLNSKRNSIKSFLQNSWKVAAAITVLLVSSFLLYFYISKPANITVMAQASNIEQVLPDGSIVSLHKGSQLVYPEKFSSRTRNVELKGEAYFNVAHNKTKPFIVASGDARIEVLGTQFNVNTSKTSDAMEVVLTSGKVSVYYKTNPENNVVLAPGEKAELNIASNKILKSSNTDPNYMAWKTRKLVFDNETLSEVINTLQNVYETPIKLTTAQLSLCRVTASFNDQSLASVLQVLKETLELQIKENGEIIEVSGKECK